MYGIFDHSTEDNPLWDWKNLRRGEDWFILDRETGLLYGLVDSKPINVAYFYNDSEGEISDMLDYSGLYKDITEKIEEDRKDLWDPTPCYLLDLKKARFVLDKSGEIIEYNVPYFTTITINGSLRGSVSWKKV